ncbi:MAG: hypothetical protein K2P14_06045, partial [Anaeroplasmataceae bacterium]|nr:hypothetical protein [Anaeroplasmataceae bacterium]
DKDGDKVTDTWKKNGSHWFYLDSDGYMAKDTIIISGSNDDKYYVDANGAKATGVWLSVDNSDDNECSDQEDNTTIWYYFGSDGKAKKGDSGPKVFSNILYGENMDKKGTFAFDEDGHMLTGWQDIQLANGTYRYYFGEENEGWAHLEWQYLEKPEYDNFEDVNPFEDEAWFWFGTNGRAAQNTTKYINGQYYTFGESGAMNSKWLKGTPGVSEITATTPPGTAAHAFYTDSIGHRRTGWLYTWAPNDPDKEYNEYWYYLNNKGEAFNDDGKDTVIRTWSTVIGDYVEDKNYDGANARSVFGNDIFGDGHDTAENVAAKVIKNKTFLFDDQGRMVTGLVEIDGGNGEPDDKGIMRHVNRVGGKALKEGIYYFSTDDGSQEGAMATGKVTISDEGDKYTYYFDKEGKAYTDTLIKGAIYGTDGRRLEAEYGSKYELVPVRSITDENGKPVKGLENGGLVIVNSNGTVKRNATKVDIEGTEYKVENYIATPK